MNDAAAVLLGAGISSGTAAATTLITLSLQAWAQRRSAKDAELAALRASIGELMAATDSAVIEHGILTGPIHTVFNARRRSELLDRIAKATMELRLTAPDSIVELVDRHGEAVSEYVEHRDLQAFKAHRDQARRDFRRALS